MPSCPPCLGDAPGRIAEDSARVRARGGNVPGLPPASWSAPDIACESRPAEQAAASDWAMTSLGGRPATWARFLLPGASMPTTLVREDDRTYRLEIRGLLRKADLDRAQRDLLATLAGDGGGTVRLLVRLQAFEGWESDPRWNDLSFYVIHGDALERIAIVGDERWRGEALMFAAADLRKGPVEYFTPDRESEARAWLGSA